MICPVNDDHKNIPVEFRRSISGNASPAGSVLG